MSEFLETVIKADAGHVWRVLDEFMDALKETKPAELTAQWKIQGSNL